MRLAAASLMGPVVVKDDGVVDAEQAKMNQEQEEKDLHSQMINKNNKDKNLARARKSLHAHSILAPGQNILKSKVKNMKDVMKGIFGGDESEEPL